MTNYMDYLQQVADNDVAELKKKDKEYGGSWLKRGGVGAFMMLARKWDRIEEQVSKDIPSGILGLDDWGKYDIIGHGRQGGKDGILDDIGDLRRYLLLVESEILNQTAARGPVSNQVAGTPTSYGYFSAQPPSRPSEQGAGAGMLHPHGYDPDNDGV